MAKLQQIVRSNGSVVNSVNLPKEVVEESGLRKGDKLEVKSLGEGKVVIVRVGEMD